MKETRLTLYWCEIPEGQENALTYKELCKLWNCTERGARRILQELSTFDNGDDFILIRSANGGGFYKTDDAGTIRAYKQECLNKGRSVLSAITKINRVLSADPTQYDLQNNMRLARERAGLTPRQVCKIMKQFDYAIDTAMLYKMENSICAPTPFQRSKFAEIYGCEPQELVTMDFFN